MIVWSLPTSGENKKTLKNYTKSYYIGVHLKSQKTEAEDHCKFNANLRYIENSKPA